MPLLRKLSEIRSRGVGLLQWSRTRGCLRDCKGSERDGDKTVEDSERGKGREGGREKEGERE